MKERGNTGYLSLVRLWLCGLLPLLASCERNEWPVDGQGKGQPVEVSVQIAGITEGDTEEVLRSSGLAPETATETVALGNGLLLEMSLAPETNSQLRASSLGADKQFRVIALKHEGANRKYASHGDFTGSGSDQTLNTFRVSGGETYDFICVSLNSKDSVPTTENLTAGQTPYFLTSAAAGADLLYGEIKNRLITTADDAKLSFSLSHKFSRVTLVADVSYNQWSIVANAAANTIRLAPFYTVRMNHEGTTTKGATITDAYFSWPAASVNYKLTSAARLVFTDGEAISLVIPQHAFKIDGKDTPSPVLTTDTTIVFPGKTLAPGRNYTLTLKFKTPKFASSNIYWDNNKLTFKPYSDTPSNVPENKYQGVFFQWGSLIGISPVGNWSTSSTLLYVPPSGNHPSGWYITTADGTAVTGSTGDHTTIETGIWTGTIYTSIPYIDDNVSGTGTRDDRYAMDAEQNTEAMWHAFKGDICQYLGKKGYAPSGYRLPTSNEWGPIEYTNWTTSYQYGWKRVDSLTDPTNDWTENNSHADASAAGTRTSIDWGGAFSPTGNFFPAAGCRYTSALLRDTGVYGHYWSGSAVNDIAYRILFGGSTGYYGVMPDAINNRQHGFTVRCVLQ